MASVRVLIYGGNGALGSACIPILKNKGAWVCSIDLRPNEAADANIVVTELTDWEKQTDQVEARVAEILNGSKLDAIFCVAGGWAGGNASSKDMIKNSNLMWKQSVWTSTISARIASQHMKEGGLLQLPGACPAVNGTPGMIGYGMAKAAIHQLTKSLAKKSGGLPKDSCAVAILPTTLDTPMNRKFMPNADHSKWTTLEFIANLFDDWLNNKERPATGSLVKMTTNDGKTTLEMV